MYSVVTRCPAELTQQSLCARNLSDHNKDYRTRRQRNRAGRTAPQCACQCANIVEALAATISTKRPDVSVSVHSKEHSLAGWSRMAFSNMATLWYRTGQPVAHQWLTTLEDGFPQLRRVPG